jgi:hypothetical protein
LGHLPKNTPHVILVIVNALQVMFPGVTAAARDAPVDLHFRQANALAFRPDGNGTTKDPLNEELCMPLLTPVTRVDGQYFHILLTRVKLFGHATMEPFSVMPALVIAL